MEQLLMMMCQTVQSFSDRMIAGSAFQEFEVLAYEQMCKMLQASCTYHGLVYQKLAYAVEGELKIAERDHAKFMQDFLEKQIPHTEPEIQDQ